MPTAARVFYRGLNDDINRTNKQSMPKNYTSNKRIEIKKQHRPIALSSFPKKYHHNLTNQSGHTTN